MKVAKTRDHWVFRIELEDALAVSHLLAPAEPVKQPFHVRAHPEIVRDQHRGVYE